MANPQRENGHIDIANDIHICRTLLYLELRQIITKFGKKNEWGPQKDYDKWLTPIKKIITKNGNTYFITKNGKAFTKNGNTITKIGNFSRLEPIIQKALGVPKETSSKKLLQRKEPSTKQKYIFADEDMKLVNLLKDGIHQNKPDYFFKGNSFKQEWANEVRLMRIGEENRSLKRIEKVIDFALTDSFWKMNILSMGKLREKFDTLEFRMREKAKKTGESGTSPPYLKPFKKGKENGKKR